MDNNGDINNTCRNSDIQTNDDHYEIGNDNDTDDDINDEDKNGDKVDDNVNYHDIFIMMMIVSIMIMNNNECDKIMSNSMNNYDDNNTDESSYVLGSKIKIRTVTEMTVTSLLIAVIVAIVVK